MMLRMCVLLVLLAAPIAEQADRRYFAYQRPIVTAATSGQSCAMLDATVFEHGAPGLPDLRVYNGDQQIPYAMRTSTAPPPRQELAQILNLGLQGANVHFDAEMPDGRYATIRMDIAARNFVTTVDVSGSATAAGGPVTKLGTYTIFDLTGEKLDRSTVLHLPESNFKILHFIVHAPIKPADVGGITIMGDSLESLDYRTISETSVVKQVGQRSVFVMNIPANVPVNRIEFVPGQLPLTFSRGVAATWRSQMIAEKNPAELPAFEQGIIRRIHSVHNGHRIDDEQFAIDPGYAPDAVPTRMTIAILNGDDAPLSIAAVRLQMRERKVCFDQSPGARYMLYYGDPQLAAAQYDYASLFQPEEHPVIAVLGAEQVNSLLQPRPDRRPLTERQPALLWIGLLAAIALLGLVALRTARRVQA